MQKSIFKAIAFLLSLAFVAYVGLSLAFGVWSPADWTDYKQTQVGAGDTDTTNPTTPDSSDKDKPANPTTPDNSDKDKPTNPTTPDSSDKDKPTNPTTPDNPGEENPPVVSITAQAQAYIDDVNAVLDALNTINENGLLFLELGLKSAELSESDLETNEVQAARKAFVLINENVIFDGYWWAPLDVRQQAAKILINAGLRAEGNVPTEELAYPSKPSPAPLSKEAQNYIDAVNAVLDTKDIRQYRQAPRSGRCV